MSTPDLFNVPQQDSPRLAWLKRHNVRTQKTDNKIGDEDEMGNKLFPWYAFVGADMMRTDSRDITGGETEADAIANLAIKRGLRLWMEEGL
jgi:hypothetical protein